MSTDPAAGTGPPLPALPSDTAWGPFKSHLDPSKFFSAVFILLISFLPLLSVSCSGRGTEQAKASPEQVAKSSRVEVPVAWVSAFGISALAIAAVLRANQNISGTSANRLLVLVLIVVAILAIVLLVPETRKDQVAPAYALLGALAAYMLKDKDSTDRTPATASPGGQGR